MKITGIDYSINSPAVFQLIVSDDLEDIQTFKYLGFSTVKKTTLIHPEIVYYDNDMFLDRFDKIFWFRDKIWDWMELKTEDYVAIEGYAMGIRSGRIFDMAEATFSIKEKIYRGGIPLRIYEPKTIKKYATGNGNSGKPEMEAFFKKTPYYSLFKNYPKKNPKEDIIDAFFVAMMLFDELRLRRGLIELKSLTKKQQESFKNKKVNLLTKEFILKR